MTNVKPPSGFAANPHIGTVPRGTLLYRVYNKSYSIDSFNSSLTHRYYGGGRFDGTADDPYSYLYFGMSREVAVSETFLRDLPLDQEGPRLLPVTRTRNRALMAFQTTRDLRLLNLKTGAGLGAVSQDSWLTTCPPLQYSQTRHWAHWIRSLAPDVEGFMWHSLREPGEVAIVLFGDRILDRALMHEDNTGKPLLHIDFDTADGKHILDVILSHYSVVTSGK